MVDEDFDESTIDASSMLPEDLRRQAKPEVPELEEEDFPDTVTVNGEVFVGKIKHFSVVEDKVAKTKRIKVIISGGSHN